MDKLIQGRIIKRKIKKIVLFTDIFINIFIDKFNINNFYFSLKMY